MTHHEDVARCCYALALIVVACNPPTPPDPTKAIYMEIINTTPDSGFAVLRRDSGGPNLQKQTLPPGGSLCWASTMVDSLYYNVYLWVADTLRYPLGRVGGEGGLTMTLQSIRTNHKFRLTIIAPNYPDTPYAQFEIFNDSGCP